jgi:fructokinase
MEKPIIAGIGELLWDCLPSGKQLGGAPCNFAYHAMQAGCESFVISAIGNDESGAEIKKVVKKLNLSTQYIQENEYPTSTVTVALDENGHPDYTIHENVAWDHIRWDNKMQELAAKMDAVCFGSLAQRNRESQESIQSFISSLKRDCLKVFDINLRQNYYTNKTILDSIMMSDVLKLNDDELPVLANHFVLEGSAENQLEKLIELFNLKYIIYTMGSKGSIIKSETETSYTEVPNINVADTVGAGDAFTAIFIAGILQGIPLKEVHKKATEIAAFVCTQQGATPKFKHKIF